MSNTIDYVYKHFLYNPLFGIVSFFANERYGIFILIIIFITLVTIQDKIKTKITEKIKYLPKILNLFIALVAILTLAVAYTNYWPNVVDFFKIDTSTETPAKSTTPSKTDTKKTTPTQTTTPAQKPPKQLYYTVSCSTCWNEVCPRNGYSYGGYDSFYYQYYYSLCKSCSCNSFNAVSFWK